jgi:hypothetical protein
VGERGPGPSTRPARIGGGDPDGDRAAADAAAGHGEYGAEWWSHSARTATGGRWTRSLASSPRRRRRTAAREGAERQEESVGRESDGLEITRGEVVAMGEVLTGEAKRVFDETAGLVEWSAPS